MENSDDPNSLTEWGHLYRTEDAPYEPSCLLRMHRAKQPTGFILSTLKIQGLGFATQLQKAISGEMEARKRGVPIHEALIPDGTV